MMNEISLVSNRIERYLIRNETRVRVSGVLLSSKKKIEIALTVVYGIGKITALKVLKDAGIPKGIKCKNLTPEQTAKLRNMVELFVTEGNLRRTKMKVTKKLIDNGSLRGRRTRQELPRRGQRTRTNSKTAKKFKLKGKNH